MEDNKTGVSADLFGKERGECEVQTCGCKEFTVDKHSYNCKECLHPAKYHINLGKKLTTKPEDKLVSEILIKYSSLGSDKIVALRFMTESFITSDTS